MQKNKQTKTATLYRTVMADHICPHGLKCKDLLQREGFNVDDKKLKSREEINALKSLHNVLTLPQVFINEDRIGGYDDLLVHLGKTTRSEAEVTYQPIIAMFSVGFLLALTMTWLTQDFIFSSRTIEWFISISMVLLGLQKLMDIERFATVFLSSVEAFDIFCAKVNVIGPIGDSQLAITPVDDLILLLSSSVLS